MSRPGNPGAAEPGRGRQYRAPAGLLEKLMAAVRPELRADDLVFDPRDPVFGGPPCAVNGCDRPHRRQGLCTSHWQRWRGSGRISLAEFTAAAEPGWHGHLPLSSCVITGCNYGPMARGMCQRHVRIFPGGREEVTDRMLIFGRRHLRSVLAEYTTHMSSRTGEPGSVFRR